MKDKGGIMVLLGSGKPPMEEAESEDLGSDLKDAQKDAGKTLVKALESGDGKDVYDAIEGIIKLCELSKDEEESDEDY